MEIISQQIGRISIIQHTLITKTSEGKIVELGNRFIHFLRVNFEERHRVRKNYLTLNNHFFIISSDTRTVPNNTSDKIKEKINNIPPLVAKAQIRQQLDIYANNLFIFTCSSRNLPFDPNLLGISNFCKR